jgi:hypothetical protein
MAAAIIIALSFGCKNEPKVVTAQNGNTNMTNGTGIFSGDSGHAGHAHTSTSIGEEVHTVVAKETLQTEKYVYIYVQEGPNEFWIATTKQEIKIGGTYFFRDGLLKTDFESKEHNKTFDKIYFVSKFVSSDHGSSSSAVAETSPNQSQAKTPVSSQKADIKGSVKVSDLVANPKKYSGKTIQVSGECVKINNNIMGRNWIHLNDGSTKKYDLVITSSNTVEIGEHFTMTGTVILNKDFGSGYKYDILIENGILVQ